MMTGLCQVFNVSSFLYCEYLCECHGSWEFAKSEEKKGSSYSEEEKASRMASTSDQTARYQNLSGGEEMCSCERAREARLSGVATAGKKHQSEPIRGGDFFRVWDSRIPTFYFRRLPVIPAVLKESLSYMRWQCEIHSVIWEGLRRSVGLP